jgi:hypothetical protein
METRTIRIGNTKTQQRYTIQSSAETLGQLKAQMSAQGIPFTGMTFTEGITQTQLLTDDSLLPTNIRYKGQITNDLVMLLTNPTKQIASGAAISRKDVYALVKKHHLEEAILAGEGNNYTRVKTETLQAYIDSACKNSVDSLNKTREELSTINNDCKAEIAVRSEQDNVSTEAKAISCSHPNTINWLYDGIRNMVDNGQLYIDDVTTLNSLIGEYSQMLVKTRHKVTDDELTNMMRSVSPHML